MTYPKTKKKKSPPKAGPLMGDAGALNQIGNPFASKQSRSDAALQMNAVYILALANISIYGQAISDACDSFKNFTESKIENMDSDDISRDAVKAVFSKALDILKELVPGAEGLTAAGKVIRDSIKDGVFAVLEKPASLVSGDIDKDKLKQTMRNLAESGKALKQRWTTSSPGGQSGQTVPVLQQMASIVSQLQSNLKAGADKEIQAKTSQAEFLDIFYDASTDEVEALLEHFYAIPSPKKSQQAGWALYKKLLQRFAPVYAWAAASRRDQLTHNSGAPSNIPTSIAKFRSEGQMYWHSHGR